MTSQTDVYLHDGAENNWNYVSSLQLKQWKLIFIHCKNSSLWVCYRQRN